MNSEFSIVSLIPLVSGIIGTAFGLFTGIFLSRFNQRQTITVKVLEQYFKAREDICTILSELANLKTNAVIQGDKIEKLKSELSKTYYKYYDLIPKEALQEINCVYVCLADPKNRLYTIKNNELTVLKEEKLEEFLERTSLLDNFKYYAYFIQKSDNDEKRRVASINMQARHALNKLNQFFTINDFISWAKHLPKS